MMFVNLKIQSNISAIWINKNSKLGIYKYGVWKTNKIKIVLLYVEFIILIINTSTSMVFTKCTLPAVDRYIYVFSKNGEMSVLSDKH